MPSQLERDSILKQHIHLLNSVPGIVDEVAVCDAKGLAALVDEHGCVMSTPFAATTLMQKIRWEVTVMVDAGNNGQQESTHLEPRKSAASQERVQVCTPFYSTDLDAQKEARKRIQPC